MKVVIFRREDGGLCSMGVWSAVEAVMGVASGEFSM